MRRGCAAAALACVLAACGGDAPEPAPVKPAPAPLPKTAPPKKKTPPKRVTRADLEKRRDELDQAVKVLEARFKKMTERHEAEAPSREVKQKLRGEFIDARRALGDAQRAYEKLSDELERLRPIAESKLTGELKKLNSEREKVARERAQIDDKWAEELKEEKVDDDNRVSPAFADLTLLREIEAAWLAATTDARARTLSGDEKAAVNASFRTWLKEGKGRAAVVAKVLAGRDATPADYDFTDLRFFVLMELLEDRLSREDIAFERKALSRTKVQLDALDERLAALDKEIGARMRAGGEDLEAYEDARKRIAHAKWTAQEMGERFKELKRRWDEMNALAERQEKEAEAVSTALDAALAELERIETRLSR